MNNSSLSHEVEMLRSLAVSLVGRDPEGEYRPEFVRKVLRSVKLRPTHKFTNKKEFLALLLKND